MNTLYVRRILNYLIPIRILLGKMPSEKLFKTYPLLAYLYKDFCTAIRQGNLQLFDTTFTKLQKPLILKGTWLTIERARSLVVRTLFRKVWLIMDKSSRLSFDVFRQGLSLSSQCHSIEMAQVECFLAGAIDAGHIKGYLSHERATAVLAKDKAFPAFI
jgi:hypothetical protein